MSTADPHAWCPVAAAGEQATGVWPVRQPLAGREWVYDDVTWRRRGGDRLLSEREVRSLITNRHARVFHVYDTDVHEHRGASLDALLAYLESFWAGRLQGTTDVEIGEFRGRQGEVVIMVQEYC